MCCSPWTSLWQGHLCERRFELIEPPEYKAMASRGIALAGKITLAQYLCLVGNGYAGNVVMRWTRHHAAKVIGRRGLAPAQGTAEARARGGTPRRVRPRHPAAQPVGRN